MKDIFKKLLKTHKPEQVREVLMKIGNSNIRWEPVGGRKNNLATINIGTDPAAGVAERITNAIDAVLEKEWEIQEKPYDIRTPRKASELWFGIEDGKISKTILYVLKKYGGMSTENIHAHVQDIHPDLCDNSIVRVIDGRRFGKKWKHAIRTSQQHLKKNGLISLEGKTWKLQT